MITGTFSFDKRQTTKWWGLISTIEGELNDTPRYRFIRRWKLNRKLSLVRALAFEDGIGMALKELEKCGVLKALGKQK